MKHKDNPDYKIQKEPAAFRRLCVETGYARIPKQNLCQPAAFRRLCVETISPLSPIGPTPASRL